MYISSLPIRNDANSPFSPVLSRGQSETHAAFDVHVAMHYDKFLYNKPTRCTDFSNFIFGMELSEMCRVPFQK